MKNYSTDISLSKNNENKQREEWRMKDKRNNQYRRIQIELWREKKTREELRKDRNDEYRQKQLKISKSWERQKNSFKILALSKKNDLEWWSMKENNE